MAIKKYSEQKNNELNYEVVEKFGKLGKKGKMQKELRLVKWNGGTEKYDIRPWGTNEDGTEKCGKGITFTGDELEDLLVLLKNLNDESGE